MTLPNNEFDRLEEELAKLFSPDDSVETEGRKGTRIEQILRRVESLREGIGGESDSGGDAASKQDDKAKS